MFKLLEIAKRIDAKCRLQEARTEDLRRMALLARQGKKDTPEFKELSLSLKSPSVFAFDDEIAALRKEVQRLT